MLTTFRRDGRQVSTPVGIRLGNSAAYFTTWATTGKVKRLANNPHVLLAPCTRRGAVLGPASPGTVRRLEGEEEREAAARGGLSHRLTRLVYKVLYHTEPVIYEVLPIDDSDRHDPA